MQKQKERLDAVQSGRKFKEKKEMICTQCLRMEAMSQVYLFISGI
jgi:hypothetical protein